MLGSTRKYPRESVLQGNQGTKPSVLYAILKGHVRIPRGAGLLVQTILRQRGLTLYNQQRIRLGERACLLAQNKFVAARRRARTPEIDRGFQFVDRNIGHGSL